MKTLKNYIKSMKFVSYQQKKTPEILIDQSIKFHEIILIQNFYIRRFRSFQFIQPSQNFIKSL